jgi:hypothetical protein
VWPYFSDDSFISLRYSQRLLEGKGLTWNDGERVEGYSNLLWVLGCAALGTFGMDLVAAARVLGAACVLGTFAVLLRAVPPTRLRYLPAACIGPLFLAASPQLQVWTCGGLEGPMVLLFVAWGSAAMLRVLDEATPSRRSLVATGVPFALLGLTRPDGPLWLAGCALVAVVYWTRAAGPRAAMVRAAWLCAVPAAALLLHTGFRLAWYGDWVPNTAHVKANWSAGRLADGVRYIWEGLCRLRAGVFLVVPAIWWSWSGRWPGADRVRRALWLLLVTSLLWCSYIVSIGGDHFLGWRHLFPPLAACALLGGVGLVVPAGSRSVVLCVSLLAYPLLGAFLLAMEASHDPHTADARTETWEWQGEVLGRALGRAYGPRRPLLACDAAGAVPYFSALPCLDMLGLNDRTIATRPSLEYVPKDMPLPPGHALGNGSYVMDRRPDLMLFGRPPCLPLAVFVSAYQFENDRRFLDGYRCAMVQLPPANLRSGEQVSMRTPLWIRLDGRAGVLHSAGGIEVPAVLFGSYRQPHPFHQYTAPQPGDDDYAAWTRDAAACASWYAGTPALAVPDAAGALWLELRDHAPAKLERIEVPAGTWRIATEPPGPVEASAVAKGAMVPMRDDGTFTWNGGPLDLACRVKDEAPLPQRLQRVVLQKP